jgi:hypothetical protein
MNHETIHNFEGLTEKQVELLTLAARNSYATSWPGFSRFSVTDSDVRNKWTHEVDVMFATWPTSPDC